MGIPAFTVLAGRETDEWVHRRFAPEGWVGEDVEVLASGSSMEDSHAEVLIVGPSVVEPLAAARAFRRQHPSGQVLFLAPPERLEHLSKVLPFAPEVAESWVIDSETPDEELRHRIDEAREAVRRRQAIRGLYSRINERVRAPAPAAAPVDPRRQQHQALAERYLTAILSHAPDALVAVALDGDVVSWNEAASRLFGRSWDEVAGQPFADLFWPEDRPGAVSILNHVALGESVRGQELRVAPMGDRLLTLEVSAGPVLGGGGAIEGISLTARDITERKQWEEHQRLLIHELNHRVKNTLATVQSIATQTLRNAETTDEARRALEERLFALSRAHDVLTQESWEGASLSDIVDQAMAPYRQNGRNRLHASGPGVRLSPGTALAVAMALHELSTNAVKYGALSNETGEVRLSWDLLRTPDGQHLRLTWVEAGGPPVRAPSRRGFGTRLIERSLAQDLGGEVRLDFAPTGLVCTIDALVRNS